MGTIYSKMVRDCDQWYSSCRGLIASTCQVHRPCRIGVTLMNTPTLPTFESASLEYLLDQMPILDGLSSEVKRQIGACCVKSPLLYPDEWVKDPGTGEPAHAVFVVA